MLLRLLVVLMFVHYVHWASAQSPVQRSPLNGANGYNGSAPRSFIIEWDSLPQVSYYEYVISDNSLCFAGCSGDTRYNLVSNTYGLESNLTINKWYYWIVRAVMKNGDTSFYSPIHSFYTLPRPEDERSYFMLGPSLVKEANIDILVNWTIDPEVTSFNLTIFNSFGEAVKKSKDFFTAKDELEQTEIFPVNLQGFVPGLYFIEFKTNKTIVPERFKFLVCQ